MKTKEHNKLNSRFYNGRHRHNIIVYRANDNN